MSSTTGRDIKGVQLISLHWDSHSSLDSGFNDSRRPNNVFLIEDFDSVLIGRAPQAHLIAAAQGIDNVKQRSLPNNSWTLPCPVMSREHAVLILRDDKVLLKDAGSHHGIWRMEQGVLERIAQGREAAIEDGEIITLGKQIEKHGKVHYPARVQIKFIFAGQPLSQFFDHSQPNNQDTDLWNFTRSMSASRTNQFGIDETDDVDVDMDVEMSDIDEYPVDEAEESPEDGHQLPSIESRSPSRTPQLTPSRDEEVRPAPDPEPQEPLGPEESGVNLWLHQGLPPPLPPPPVPHPNLSPTSSSQGQYGHIFYDIRGDWSFEDESNNWSMAPEASSQRQSLPHFQDHFSATASLHREEVYTPPPWRTSEPYNSTPPPETSAAVIESEMFHDEGHSGGLAPPSGFQSRSSGASSPYYLFRTNAAETGGFRMEDEDAEGDDHDDEDHMFRNSPPPAPRPLRFKNLLPPELSLGGVVASHGKGLQAASQGSSGVGGVSSAEESYIPIFARTIPWARAQDRPQPFPSTSVVAADDDESLPTVKPAAAGPSTAQEDTDITDMEDHKDKNVEDVSSMHKAPTEGSNAVVQADPPQSIVMIDLVTPAPTTQPLPSLHPIDKKLSESIPSLEYDSVSGSPVIVSSFSGSAVSPGGNRFGLGAMPKGFGLGALNFNKGKGKDVEVISVEDDSSSESDDSSEDSSEEDQLEEDEAKRISEEGEREDSEDSEDSESSGSSDEDHSLHRPKVIVISSSSSSSQDSEEEKEKENTKQILDIATKRRMSIRARQAFRRRRRLLAEMARVEAAKQASESLSISPGGSAGRKRRFSEIYSEHEVEFVADSFVVPDTPPAATNASSADVEPQAEQPGPSTSMSAVVNDEPELSTSVSQAMEIDARSPPRSGTPIFPPPPVPTQVIASPRPLPIPLAVDPLVRPLLRSDMPSPAKRARVEIVIPSAAGVLAGAVAGSIITWAGLAYL